MQCIPLLSEINVKKLAVLVSCRGLKYLLLSRFKLLCLAILWLPLSIAGSVAAADEKLLFVSGMHSNKAKLQLLQAAAEPKGLTIDHQAARALGDLVESQKLFAAYDLVIFYGVSNRETEKVFARYTPIVETVDSKFLAINGLPQTSLHKGIDSQQAQALHDYYANGGAANMAAMADFLNYRIFANSDRPVAAPIIYPQRGIYHPDYPGKIFTDLSSYLSWRQWPAGQSAATEKSGSAVVGILLNRMSIESADSLLIDQTIAQLEARGARVVPFFFSGGFSADAEDKSYLPLLQRDGKTLIDMVINFRSIHWAAQRKREFEQLAVPVMQALTYYHGDQQHWQQSSQGITPNMAPFQLVLPEAAGVIDPTIVAAINQATEATEVIDYQLDHLLDRALKLAALKRKANADKKLTVMVWGDSDVGASFLNIPTSLASISRRLNAEGYQMSAVEYHYFTERIDRILTPFYRSYELDALLSDDLAELMPVADYLAWFELLPQAVRQPIVDYWGQPKDNFMVVEREHQGRQQPHFVLPRMRLGNMLVMRQPPRSDSADDEKSMYHKGSIPMNHYYLAAYFYARQYWGSDAIVHLGTHGSQEYLSGKERGLSRYDQGNLAVGDTPIVYPFIVDDVGEAMQTKRRGSATVVAHMTPPFAAAGLQGDVADIHELMHQYKSMDEGGVKRKTGQQIVSDCLAKNLCKDIAWDEKQIAADFDGFMAVLHDYLVDLASQNQPLGLHSFGELPEQDLIVSTLVQMLGSDFVQRAAQLERDWPVDESGQDHRDDYLQGHQQDHHQDHHQDHQHDHAHVEQQDEQKQHFDQHVMQQNGDSLRDLLGFKTVEKFVLNAADTSDLDKILQQDIERGRDFYRRFTGIKELDHLVAALAGQYIPVKNGGDPVRNPDALATGYNLYGFDPARVPTRAAFEQGKELTEQLIADYYAKHGRYPDKLAFSLWSMETMRHYGVLESQALYAMGMKPLWSKDGRVIGSEIIPAAELKRPRVDVVLSATGLYRDAFPNVMQWLAMAVDKVATLKEENNSIWHNAQRIEKELLTEGVEAAEAQYLSTVRLFSNESGNYGSGLGGSVVASDSWEQDDKLADLYLSRMGFFYGADNSRWGQKAGAGVDLYRKQLSGTDMALFSRSSNVYGMLASDDPFQYFGGLALAVRNIDGQSPEMYISNLRDAGKAKAENAATFLAKELRTRSLHKRWLSEMKKEGYIGAVTMAGNISNFFGWQVVDPNLVRQDQWQALYEVYIEDKHQLALDEWFEAVDPKAQAQILERMLEAVRKDYWQADEVTLQSMIERYQTLVNRHDLAVSNDKLREFVNQRATGFGLALPAAEVPALDLSAPPLPEQTPAQASTQAAASETVTGQKLDRVEPQESEPQDRSLLFVSLWVCLFFVLLGICRQAGWFCWPRSALLYVSARS